MSKGYRLEVITPERVFFDDTVEMVIIETSDGQLGVMAGHVPMVAPIKIGVIKIKQNGEWREASIDEGYMEITPQETIVMSHSAEWPEEIDEKRAREEYERAQEKLRQKRSMEEYHQSKASLARAMARLRVKKNYNYD